MSRKKEVFAVIDVETTASGTIGKNVVFDFGGVFADREGNIYGEFSFLVWEVFCFPKNWGEPFLFDKYHLYIEGLEKGEFHLAKYADILQWFTGECQRLGVNKIYAYNASFDSGKLADTEIALYGTDYFQHWLDTMEVRCIWHMAATSLYRRKFVKWCVENGLVSEKGNVRTTAEAGYGYLTGTPDFNERHTGLEDCRIELEILQAVFKTHNKAETAPNSQCWRIPQKYL